MKKTSRKQLHKRFERGLSLVELLVSLTIGAMILGGLTNVIGESLRSEYTIRQKLSLAQQTRFAMKRLTDAVGKTRYLMIPLVDNPSTAWDESVRDVLAVTLDPTLDRDNDGWADANNDKDFQDLNQNGSRDPGEWERIDEDTHSDMTNDGESGIIGIDDDGDGSIDEAETDDDDEDGTKDEEEEKNGDLDGDFSLNEDRHQQMVRDDKPGLASIDDDGDGTVDEGDINDDDEDGLINEDWFDPVVYYLNGTDLIERTPAINPADGAEFLETTIADHVTSFQVTRLPLANKRATLVRIEITLTADDGESYSLSATVAEGGFF